MLILVFEYRTLVVSALFRRHRLVSGFTATSCIHETMVNLVNTGDILSDSFVRGRRPGGVDGDDDESRPLPYHQSVPQELFLWVTERLNELQTPVSTKVPEMGPIVCSYPKFVESRNPPLA